jgi:hypothetical protein
MSEKDSFPSFADTSVLRWSILNSGNCLGKYNKSYQSSFSNREDRSWLGKPEGRFGAQVLMRVPAPWGAGWILFIQIPLS